MEQNFHSTLKQTFGHDQFRPHQEEIVRSILQRRDTLAVLPTGGGKSLCYQLPAVLLDRPTLVISPLIALMQDQLDGLPPAVRAVSTVINSSIESAEIRQRMAAVVAGDVKLVFAAPERLRRKDFMTALAHIRPALIVIDEAHCVSFWGHDFRPDYLYISKAITALETDGSAPTVLALTATATDEVQNEIGSQLGRDFARVVAPVYRSNLFFDVTGCANADEKLRHVGRICRETPGTGIIYVNSREKCEQIAHYLNRSGISAIHYHAGLDADARRSAQAAFMAGERNVMVATVAFGMGVDKQDVRYVVHCSLPESLEAYTQEAGRAGRDGKPSRCTLLTSSNDKANLTSWLRAGAVQLNDVRLIYRWLKTNVGREPGLVDTAELIAAVYGPDATNTDYGTRIRVAVSLLERSGLVMRHMEIGAALHLSVPPAPAEGRAALDHLLEHRREREDRRLEEILAFAGGSKCRHVAISAHFGQILARCETQCDVCTETTRRSTPRRLKPPTVSDVPDFGRTILEALTSAPFRVGRSGIAKVLIGAEDASISKDRIRNFGALSGLTRNAVIGLIDRMITEGLLHLDRSGEYPLIIATDAGRTAMASEGPILANAMKVRPVQDSVRSGSADAEEPGDFKLPTEDEAHRYELLRAWRKETAERSRVPAYIVLPDSTLRAIAGANPQDLETLATIKGVGTRKLGAYGSEILTVLTTS